MHRVLLQGSLGSNKSRWKRFRVDIDLRYYGMKFFLTLTINLWNVSLHQNLEKEAIKEWSSEFGSSQKCRYLFFWKVKSRHMERLCSRSSSLIYVLHFWPFPGVIDTTASGRLQVARSAIWASRIWYLFTQAAVARLNTSTQANKHVSRDEPDMCNKI